MSVAKKLNYNRLLFDKTFISGMIWRFAKVNATHTPYNWLVVNILTNLGLAIYVNVI